MNEIIQIDKVQINLQNKNLKEVTFKLLEETLKI